ncbi:hypothetical protein O9993_04810 [Vibrio lentus]|nr:hypothetical protein [Vibrio lentus]
MEAGSFAFNFSQQITILLTLIVFWLSTSLLPNNYSKGGQFEDANREGFILQIKKHFSEKIAEGEDHNTLYHYFSQFLNTFVGVIQTIQLPLHNVR